MAQISGYRRLENGVLDVDFYRRQGATLRQATMRQAFNGKIGVRITVSAAVTSLAIASLLSMPTALAQIQHGHGHTMISANDLKWSPGPPSIPPGAQAAVLYGDPSKEGLFALRLKLPKGYAIAPHTHPKPEIVTVISGTFRLGMGETADRGKAQPLGPGSFLALEPGMAHFAFTDDETVIQLNSTGPWTLTYVNPSDDPRKKQ